MFEWCHEMAHGVRQLLVVFLQWFGLLSPPGRMSSAQCRYCITPLCYYILLPNNNYYVHLDEVIVACRNDQSSQNDAISVISVAQEYL